MIVRYLKASRTFGGVFYSTDKMGLGKAELMAAVNFDALNSLEEIRPVDYFNYLKAITARNKGVSEPQVHLAMSTTRQSHDKHQLTDIAMTWLEKMGYSKQPYLIFFHDDTAQNHVHIVTTRIDWNGRKINSGFEHIRGLRAMNQVMGLDEDKSAQKDLGRAISYRFSTLAQFKLILEKQGYTIKSNDLIKFGNKLASIDPEKIKLRPPDPYRAAQLKAIFEKYAPQYDTAAFASHLKTKMGIELVFHSKDSKPAYGYTVIDHAQKNVYKGSKIMPLKDLIPLLDSASPIRKTSLQVNQKTAYTKNFSQKISSQISQATENIHFNINIAKDVDDAAVHGRRRKKKTRTNHR